MVLHSSYNCTQFLHSLLTKAKEEVQGFEKKWEGKNLKQGSEGFLAGLL